jgi:transcription elongation factor
MQGCRCEVKHVYRDYVFLFNAEFDKSNGVSVERAENCVVVAKNIESFGQRGVSSKPAASSFGNSNN